MSKEELNHRELFKTLVSDHVLSQEFQDNLRKYWCNNVAIKTTNLEIITEPYRVCKISNFLRSPEFIDELKIELSDIQMKRIVSDLYHNEQTNDLQTFGGECISSLHQIFRNDMVAWLENNTNIELNSKLSMASACYFDTDFLLCHDDNAGDRKVAYILYIVPSWSPDEGGSLDLFDTDEHGYPRNIVRSIYPEYNSLVFFEVSNHSYHQVAEVMNPDLPRWSINGWFHGPKKQTEPPFPVIEHQYFDPIDRDEDLTGWVNETYQCAGMIKGINRDIETESWASLGQFIKAPVYEELSKEITADTIKWKKAGPANLRNYEIADPSTLTGRLKAIYEAFQTLVFCSLIEKYTDLELRPTDKNPKPVMTIELQRWSKSCYTLICDKNITQDDHLGSDDQADDENSPPKQNGSDDQADDEPSPPKENGNNDEKMPAINLNDSFNGYHKIPGSPKVEDTKDVELPELQEAFPSETISIEEAEALLGSPKTKRRRTGSNDDERELASCSKPVDYNNRSPPLHPDSEDSQVSDIGDYLSDSDEDQDDEVRKPKRGSSGDQRGQNNGSNEDDDDDSCEPGPGMLDVVIQFNTDNLSSDEDIIHYLDPTDSEGNYIHITPENNQLSLVYYKDSSTCRVHKYINHYFEGYFYNLICTYHEHVR